MSPPPPAETSPDAVVDTAAIDRPARVRGSLREEKKAATRRALVETALRRFLTRGYDETTLEDICEEVGVSVRTALRYFESKEQLALARHTGPLTRFRSSIAERPADVTVLDHWRAFVGRFAAAAADSPDQFELQRLIYAVPALHSRWLAILVEYEDLLAAELAAEAGTDPDDLGVRLAATCLLGGNEAVARRWITCGGTTDLRATCLAVVDLVAERFPPHDGARTPGAPPTTRASRRTGRR